MAIDSLLHLALSIVRDRATDAPWWVGAQILERAVWVVAAALLWCAAPVVAPTVSPLALSRPLRLDVANQLVGRSMIVLPLVWVAATLIVFAARVTFAGSWRTDAARFLEPYYYSDLVLANAPWMLAGAALTVLARHLSND